LSPELNWTAGAPVRAGRIEPVYSITTGGAKATTARTAAAGRILEATAATPLLPYVCPAIKSSHRIDLRREDSVGGVHEGVKGPPNLLANPDGPDPEPALTVPAQAHSQER
jgi:hypothetical protein